MSEQWDDITAQILELHSEAKEAKKLIKAQSFEIQSLTRYLKQRDHQVKELERQIAALNKGIEQPTQRR